MTARLRCPSRRGRSLALFTAPLLALGLPGTLHAQAPMLRLVRTDGAAHDHFGQRVALTGHVGLVAAPRDDDMGTDSGSVYAFDLRTGAQLAKWTASDGVAGDRFGWGLAVDGPLAAIGAPHADGAGQDSGAVYLFDVRTGIQRAKIVAPDAVGGEAFGIDVRLAGDRLIVGAPSDDDVGYHSGSVYVFDARSGALLRKIVPSDAEEDDEFGWALAAEGDTLLVGTLDHDNGVNQGSAYLFDLASGQELAKLLPPASHQDSYYGLEVVLRGGIAFVCEPYQPEDERGRVYAYDAALGVPLGDFGAIGVTAYAQFGSAAEASDAWLVVGAPGTGEDRGAIHLFDRATFLPLARYALPTGTAGDGFGSAIAVSNLGLLVGAGGDSVDGPAAGAAYYRLLGR